MAGRPGGGNVAAMSASLAFILIFGGIALIAIVLIGLALLEISGEHRDNVAYRIRRHLGG
jgi:hypothetical protein